MTATTTRTTEPLFAITGHREQTCKLCGKVVKSAGRATHARVHVAKGESTRIPSPYTVRFEIPAR